MSNVVTKKFKYSTDDEFKEIILSYIKNYNNALRFTFNRFQENPKISTKEISSLHRELNNIFIDSHFLGSTIYEAKALYKANQDNKVIFGGKGTLKERENKKITNEEWKLKRLLPLCNIGKANGKGNTKFQILSTTEILFKPCRDKHVILTLPKLSKRNIREIEKLIELQNNKVIPITYKLDTEYIYISYDYDVMKEFFKPSSKIRDRIMSVDLNPNYIGWSVLDWRDEDNYKIIDKGVISLKLLNDKIIKLKEASNSKKNTHLHNKINYEIKDIAQQLVKISNHYRCEIFGIENLNMRTSNKKKGHIYNRLCNNMWKRDLFTKQVKKYCSVYNIKLLEIAANFSSFIGNLSYRNEQLPDMVLAAIEISRRAYEYNHQYILKDKHNEKNIIFPTSKIQLSKIKKSLEELNYPTEFESLKGLYYSIKEKENSKQRYRVSLEGLNPSRVFRKFYYKKQIILYSFI